MCSCAIFVVLAIGKLTIISTISCHSIVTCIFRCSDFVISVCYSVTILASVHNNVEQYYTGVCYQLILLIVIQHCNPCSFSY